jgi:hypothetical protein
VAFAAEGSCGAERTAESERKTRDVSREVTAREKDRPGFERSRMYHSAGLTRARVRVSWRVDCQGRRRCRVLVRCYPGWTWWTWITYDGEGNTDKGADAADYVVDLLADR